VAALEGQVAVVTGGFQGIGRAIADRLGDDGATVEVFDLSATPPVDVTDEQAVRAAVESVLRRRGRVDILVNNAGIFPYTQFEKLTYAEWRRVLAANLDSVFLVTHAVYPAMQRRGYGRIVNISSSAFLVGVGELTHYSASKAGVIGFTRALASGAGAHGITVNAISPGFIETPGVLSNPEDAAMFEVIVPEQAIKRRGRPQDIAECVAYLVQREAGFITGQTINIDGGHRFI
jgi:NAD(P)-dependent dehydrogenase (short-subunit alcohol dehydrogenase family)